MTEFYKDSAIVVIIIIITKPMSQGSIYINLYITKGKIYISSLRNQ